MSIEKGKAVQYDAEARAVKKKDADSKTETETGSEYDFDNGEAAESKHTYENLTAKDYYTNSEIYSYDFLTSQKPMKTVVLPKTGSLPQTNGIIDRKKIINLGINNAKSVGYEKNGKVYVKNNYSNRELRIDNESIKHGMGGDYKRVLTNSRIGSVIGDVVKNAIPINGLKNASDNVDGTYAMVSYCTDEMGREFIAVITVELQSSNVDSFEIIDVAHAINGRQKNNGQKTAVGSQVGTKPHGVTRIKATISIADLL